MYILPITITFFSFLINISSSHSSHKNVKRYTLSTTCITWGNALIKLADDPFYPGLKTHEIEPLSKRYGMKVWQSYLENKKSGAMRMYWVYGPDQKDITVIGLEPHLEDKKNGAYDRVTLSDME